MKGAKLKKEGLWTTLVRIMNGELTLCNLFNDKFQGQPLTLIIGSCVFHGTLQRHQVPSFSNLNMTFHKLNKW